MDRDQIIQMARDAGILSDLELMPQNQWRQDTIRELERFATAIRAATKEEDAGICESRETPGTASVAILRGAADAIRASK